MLSLFKQFYKDLSGTPAEKPEVGVLPEAEYLKEKRKEAIAYLGDKWICAKANYVKNKEQTQ